jgi:hypothetical protein
MPVGRIEFRQLVLGVTWYPRDSSIAPHLCNF